MELHEITEEIKAFPGEYIYHIPTKQIVLCGSFNRGEKYYSGPRARKIVCGQNTEFSKDRRWAT